MYITQQIALVVANTLYSSSGLLEVLLQIMTDHREQLKLLIKLTDDVITVVEVSRTMLIGKMCWYLHNEVKCEVKKLPLHASMCVSVTFCICVSMFVHVYMYMKVSE